jgi:hypothetical protein
MTFDLDDAEGSYAEDSYNNKTVGLLNVESIQFVAESSTGYREKWGRESHLFLSRTSFHLDTVVTAPNFGPPFGLFE